MIKGLEMAGSNPTQANVLKDVRGLKSYDTNGCYRSPSITRPSSGTTCRSSARG
jgi:hypothetical protein